MSSATFYKWRSKYGGIDASLISKLKELEAENRRLKKMYADRVEISNPGTAPINVSRFIDEYQSRNEWLAKEMYLLNICEEKAAESIKSLNLLKLQNYLRLIFVQILCVLQRYFLLTWTLML
jgi:putative transposase